MNKHHLILFILFCCWITPCQAQFADQKVKTLATKLTKHAQTDRQKVDSIFYWITDNITYDVVAYKKPPLKRYPDFNLDSNLDSAAYMKQYNLAVVNMVLQNKKAICDGYSRLFKSLCDYSGVDARVINGGARYNIISEMIEAHAWNAVKLKDKWYLLDLTWASGYVWNNQYTKKRELHYYLTPPSQFIIDHLPENQRWTLLPRKITPNEFLDTPATSSLIFKEGITGFFPKQKLIKVKKGESLKITIHCKSVNKLGGVLILEKDIETKATLLKDKYTTTELDSMIKKDANMMLRIPKFEIVKTQQEINKITYFIKPLNNRLKGLVFSSYSSGTILKYDVKIED